MVASGKEFTCQCRRHKRQRFHPWVGKIPWRRKQQPTPVFLPGKSHGQRTLVGYSPWGRRELDMIEHWGTFQKNYYTYTTYTGILCKNQYLTFKKIQIYIFLQPLVLSKYVTQSPHGSGFHIFPYTIFKLLHFLTYLLLSLHHISNLFMFIIRFLFKQTGLPWWLRW